MRSPREDTDNIIVAVTLKSLAPGMLLNPGEGKLLDWLFDSRIKCKSGIGRRSHDVASERLLKDGQGKIYLPSRYVLASLVNAGRQVQHTGNAMLSTERDSLVPGIFDLLDSELVLTDHDGSEAKWAPTKFPCWVESRERRDDLVVRPRVKRWQMTVRVRLSTREIAESKARQLFEIAGRFSGLGAFRVGQNRRSRFGRFVVSGWEHTQVPLALDAA